MCTYIRRRFLRNGNGGDLRRSNAVKPRVVILLGNRCRLHLFILQICKKSNYQISISCSWARLLAKAVGLDRAAQRWNDIAVYARRRTRSINRLFDAKRLFCLIFFAWLSTSENLHNAASWRQVNMDRITRSLPMVKHRWKGNWYKKQD